MSRTPSHSERIKLLGESVAELSLLVQTLASVFKTLDDRVSVLERKADWLSVRRRT